MTSSSKEATAHEVVIVRRRGGDGEDAHHGGVWKIAFADFMTALMTFFLVMWLINATDKKTLAQVAAYFNPIKLSSKSPIARGIRDETAAGQGTQQEKTKASDEKNEHNSDRAGEAPAKVSVPPSSQGDSAASKRDAATEEGEQTETGISQASPEWNTKGASDGAADTLTGMRKQTNRQKEGAKGPLADAAAENKTGEVVETGAAIRQELSEALSDLGQLKRPRIEVRAVAEGILISLTDTLDFEMFSVAAADAAPALVAVMGRIAHVIAKHPGPLVVRGHTDGRAYRAGGYGNWRLSIDRAIAARDLLMRAGVDDARFWKVEGYADRALKTPNAPFAAENRRIEILVQTAAP